MRGPWFLAVLLTLAVLAGYAAGARPVQAQAEALPFAIAETVTFRCNLTSAGSVESRKFEARLLDAPIPSRRKESSLEIGRTSSG